MVNIIVEVSKYMIILLMTAYTFSCFSIFAQSYEEDEKRVYILQNVLMFMMQFLAYAVMYLKTEEHKLLLFFAVQVVLLVAVILLYSILYPNVSRLIVNNMCMLLSAGLIMITRLSYESAVKQFIFIALGTAFGLVVDPKAEISGGLGLYLRGSRICGASAGGGVRRYVRRGEAWIYHRRDWDPAIGICKDLVCILCGGQPEKFYGI